MAKQAEAHRVAALFNLQDSMRQVNRYRQTSQPSVRLLKQKVNSVVQLEAELKRSHLQYCEKANIDVNSKEAKEFIETECDAAIDLIDECMITIHDEELRLEANETIQQKDEEEQIEIQRYKLQVNADARFVEEVITKINELKIASGTPDNVVLMRLYFERVQDISERLNKAWDVLIASNPDEGEDKDEVVNILEVTFMRMKIQDAISDTVVFIEKNKSDKAANQSGYVRENFSGSIAKLEKIKNPTFSGDIRTFSKFQKDFKEIVEPNYSGPQLSYVLRESCLSGEAKALVENIDEVDRIWEKLIDRYGDKLRLVEVVMLFSNFWRAACLKPLIHRVGGRFAPMLPRSTSSATSTTTKVSA